MQPSKLVRALLTIAIFLIASATASAAVEFLPGKAGTKLTGTSGKSTLQVKGGGTVTCAKSEVKGELLSAATLLTLRTFTGCTFAGLAINSLGDASGVVLVHREIQTCVISTSPLVAAILNKPLPLHLEIPSLSELILEEGSDVGSLTPGNKKSKAFTLTEAQKEGKQEIEGCLNAEGTKIVPETLTVSINGSTPLAAAEEEKESTITFETEQEFMT